jgi:flagellar biosynthesis/type III secretory pathway protein FliH
MSELFDPIIEFESKFIEEGRKEGIADGIQLGISEGLSLGTSFFCLETQATLYSQFLFNLILSVL